MVSRVLITGANGFIGSHLVSEMMAADIPITAIVRPSSNVEILKKLKCYNIISTTNYSDSSLIRQLSVSKPEYLIHCAWDNKNSSDVIINMKILLNSLELANKLKCKGFVGIGSYEEYGDLRTNLVEELTPNPNTLFGKLKLASCLTTLTFCKNSNINGSHVRLSIPYGVTNSKNWSIPDIVDSFNRNDSPKIRNSNDRYDFIHVSDVARGIISLINKEANGIYNIACGESEKIQNLVNMIKTELKSDIIPKYLNNYIENDINLNISKISNKTGWKPSISIWDGISMLIQEKKFTSSATNFEEFSKRIRNICKSQLL